MNQEIGNKRLLKVATFLRTLKPKQFYFGKFVHSFDVKKECGTVCCAYGWLPKIFPRSWEWRNNSIATFTECYMPRLKKGPGSINGDSYGFFRISTEDIEFLFYPRDTSYGVLPHNAKPLTVAKHIEKFVANRRKKAKVK